MKKLTFLAVLLSMLCAWPTPALAQGIEKGDQMVSVFLGSGMPLNKSGVTADVVTWDAFDTTTLDWGDASTSYGVQYMYAVTPHFAIGAEYNGNNFGDSEYEREYFAGPTDWGEREVDGSMDVQNFMVAGRYTVNPQAKVRFYVPVGLGIAAAKATFKFEDIINKSGVIDRDGNSMDGSSTSLAYYVGLGLEGTFCQDWVWGVEGRYQGFRFDYDKIESGLGSKNQSFFSVLLKMGYRF